jgi:hypothetical protein
MLVETKIVDQVTVDAVSKTVFVREANIVERDGFEIARSYHRMTVTPGSDISGLPESVQAICRAAWA